MKKTLLALSFASLAVASAASANIIPFTASTNSGGDCSASEVCAASGSITTGAGTISIILTSTLLNPISVGQTVSGISFTLSNTPTSISGFTQASQNGNEVDLPDGTIFASTPTHWGFARSGSTVEVATVGVVGGKPVDLIVGDNGAHNFSNANNGSFAHNPYIDGTGLFSFNAPGILSTTTISAVTIFWGTGNTGDTNVTVPCTGGQCGGPPGSGINPTSAGPVPEPGSTSLALLGLAVLSGTLLRRKYVSGRRA